MKYVFCCAVLLFLLQVTLCEGEESETRISVRQLGSLSGLLSTILALLTNLLGGGPVTAGVSVGVGAPATTTGLLGGLLGGGGTSTTTGGGGLLGGLLNGLLGGLLGGGGGGGGGGGLLGGLLGK